MTYLSNYNGDWGLGIGDWGLGIGRNPQSPIPNPQSPIPNSIFYIIDFAFKLLYLINIYYFMKYFFNNILIIIANKLKQINNTFLTIGTLKDK